VRASTQAAAAARKKKRRMKEIPQLKAPSVRSQRGNQHSNKFVVEVFVLFI